MREDVARSILGLEGGNLSVDCINKAYCEAMQMNHPDRYAGDEELRQHAERQSRLINEARQVLLSRAQDEYGSTVTSSNDKVDEEFRRERQARQRAAYYEKSREHVPNNSQYSSSKRQEHGKQHAASQGTVSRDNHGASKASNEAAVRYAFEDNGCGIILIIVAAFFFIFIIFGYAGCSSTTYHSGTSSDTRGTSAGKVTPEVGYVSEDKGFSAHFPAKPDIEKRIETVESMGGKVSTTSFYGDSGVSFTYVHVADSENLALEINYSMQERDRNKWLGNIISKSLDSFDEMLTPKGKTDEVSYGSECGYPSATLMVPCTYRPKGSSQSTEVFYYASCVVRYSKVYLVTGGATGQRCISKGPRFISPSRYSLQEQEVWF